MRLSSILSMVRRESVFIESGPYETDGVSVMPAPTGPACPVPQMSSFVRHSDWALYVRMFSTRPRAKTKWLKYADPSEILVAALWAVPNATKPYIVDVYHGIYRLKPGKRS